MKILGWLVVAYFGAAGVMQAYNNSGMGTASAVPTSLPDAGMLVGNGLSGAAGDIAIAWAAWYWLT